METKKNTLDEAREEILEILKGLDDDDLVYIWNEYCQAARRPDDEIMDAYMMEEYFNTLDTMDALNRFYFGSDDYSQDGSANPNRNYFCFNGYGNIESFDYIYNEYTETFNHIYVDDMIEYMIDELDGLDNNEIQEILNNLNED